MRTKWKTSRKVCSYARCRRCFASRWRITLWWELWHSICKRRGLSTHASWEWSWSGRLGFRWWGHGRWQSIWWWGVRFWITMIKSKHSFISFSRMKGGPSRYSCKHEHTLWQRRRRVVPFFNILPIDFHCDNHFRAHPRTVHPKSSFGRKSGLRACGAEPW